MKVGIIGLGKMGKIHYKVLQDLQKEGLVNEICVYDIDPNVKGFNDFNSFMGYCDYFVIATPTDCHIGYCYKLMETGKPILCVILVSYLTRLLFLL